MVTSQRFPSSARLNRPSEFARVFEFHRSASGGPLVLYACPRMLRSSGTIDAESPVRIGISASRRIGNAVVRKRWKRRLREAFRMAWSRLPAGNDFVVVVRAGRVPSGAAGARQVEDMIVALANRVTARVGYAEAAKTEAARRVSLGAQPESERNPLAPPHASAKARLPKPKRRK